VDDFTYLALRFHPGETPVAAENDPGCFLYGVAGEVLSVAVRHAGGGEDEARELAGKFELYYADMEAAVDANVSPFDVLDSVRHASDYYEPVYGGPEGGLSPELEKLLGEAPRERNLLILNRLEILPKFRGRDIGLQVLRRLMQRFSAGAGVVGMKPVPLQLQAAHAAQDRQWRETLRLDAFAQDPAAAQARLERHCARLGFRRLGGSGLMFRRARS